MSELPYQELRPRAQGSFVQNAGSALHYHFAGCGSRTRVGIATSILLACVLASVAFLVLRPSDTPPTYQLLNHIVSDGQLGVVEDATSVFYGPITFQANAGQAMNKMQTNSDSEYTGPQKVLRYSNGTSFGSVQFTRAIKWNGGDPKLMAGFVLAETIGVQRDIHWHTKGDEWAYVIKGEWALTMSAPTKFNPQFKSTVPWQGTYGTAKQNAVWFFPAGWWHTIICQSVDGCAAILFFNSPPSVEYHLNSPQLAQTVVGMPPFIAASVMGVSKAKATEVIRAISGKSAVNKNVDYLDVSVIATTAACNKPGFAGKCPQRGPETKVTDFPSVVDMKEVGNTRTFEYIHGGEPSCGYEGEYGAKAWDVTASNGMHLLNLTARAGRGGSSGMGMSGQLVELYPGGTRPPVWTLNADGVLFVAQGSITLWIYPGDQYTGFAPWDSHALDEKATVAIRLGPNDAAYIPQNNVYYFTENACETATLTLVFNHPEWEEIDMQESLRVFAKYEIEGSMNNPNGR
mmetsp:Transcript_22289/g.47004  ORF Transcript_22289/g.47004 Transcript_22289/m.47004 type:complete len:516 (-) Transcript_22289:677-2224(-)